MASTPKGKSAKQIVKDLAQDVETERDNVVGIVGEYLDAPLPDQLTAAYLKYQDAVARLERATGAGA